MNGSGPVFFWRIMFNRKYWNVPLAIVAFSYGPINDLITYRELYVFGLRLAYWTVIR